jgi:hypothetical protein
VKVYRPSAKTAPTAVELDDPPDGVTVRVPKVVWKRLKSSTNPVPPRRCP